MKGIRIAWIAILSIVVLGLCVLLGYGLSGRFHPEGSNTAMGTGSVSLLQEQQFDVSNIETLTVNYEKNSQDVFLYEGEGNVIVVREYANYAVEEEMLSRIGLSGSTLTVQGVREKGSWVSLNRCRYTEILLPADYAGAVEIATASGEIGIDRELALKKELKLSSTSGDIMVGKAAASELRISSTSGEVRTGDLAAETLFIGTTSGDITTGKAAASELRISATSGEVRLGTLTAETFFIETNSGDITTAEAAASELRISSTSGEVRTGDLTAEKLRIGTTSGDIHVTGAEGEFSISSASGTVMLDDGSGCGTVETTSGDIRLSFAALTGELTVDSTSGEVVIKLPEATALDFSAATVSGEISTFFDELLSFSKKGDRASGSVGSGDHALKITTTSGDIRIKKN